MTTIEDAAAIALRLPDVSEGTRFGHRTWFVGSKKAFAWERPYSKADRKRFGDAVPPGGPILAVSVADLGEKEAVLATYPSTFTISHFDGFPAVLIQLSKTSKRTLAELIEDAWLACAPPDLITARRSAPKPRATLRRQES